MNTYNSQSKRETKTEFRKEIQPILRKMWNKKGSRGTIKRKKVQRTSKISGKIYFLFYAYFVFYDSGKYKEEYLGACDSMGRPIKKA